MVNIYSAICDPAAYHSFYRVFAPGLPAAFREQANAFHQSADAYRYLLGKFLLLKGISLLGYGSLGLKDIRYNAFNKPYFLTGPDFSISHSGQYVLCAISHQCRVGLDIEEIKEINPGDFRDCFTGGEWSQIKRSGNPVTCFYRLWTRKEAVIKADGRAMSISLPEVDVTGKEVMIEFNRWYIEGLNVSNTYMAHLAVSEDIGVQYSIQRLI